MEFYQELLFTAILSIILVSFLGKLVSVAAGDETDRDRQPTTKIAAERRGNDSLKFDQISSVEVSSDHDKRCEEEIVIEKFDGDLFEKGEVAEGSEIGVRQNSEASRSDYSARIVSEIEAENDGTRIRSEGADAFLGKAVESGDNVVEVTKREFLEAEELQLDLEEVVESRLIESEAEVEEADAFLGKSIDGGDNVVEVTKEEIEDSFFPEMLMNKENEFLETDVNVHGIQNVGKSATFVGENGGDDITGLREEYVLKEGSETHDDRKKQSLLSEEDEWEGIERTELEKQFNEAATYVAGMGGEFALSSFNDDEQMKLYGLHKVVVEGPCYDPQPMALMVSARAKWHAWQKMGNMNPDAAMEQYMSLLSDKIPGWMGEKPEGGVVKQESEVVELALSGACMPDFSSGACSLPNIQTESKLLSRREECPSFIDEKVKCATTEHTDQGFTRAQ